MARIKMTTSLVLKNNKAYYIGQTVEVDDDIAKKLVNKNLAIFIEDQPLKIKEEKEKAEEKPKRQRRSKKEVK